MGDKGSTVKLYSDQKERHKEYRTIQGRITKNLETIIKELGREKGEKEAELEHMAYKVEKLDKMVKTSRKDLEIKMDKVKRLERSLEAMSGTVKGMGEMEIRLVTGCVKKEEELDETKKRVEEQRKEILRQERIVDELKEVDRNKKEMNTLGQQSRGQEKPEYLGHTKIKNEGGVNNEYKQVERDDDGKRNRGMKETR